MPHHICIYRECQEHQGRKERAGMLAQWWVLFSNLSTYNTHLKFTAVAQCQPQVCSQHHFSDISYFALWLLRLWLDFSWSCLDIDLTSPHFPNAFEFLSLFSPQYQKQFNASFWRETTCMLFLVKKTTNELLLLAYLLGKFSFECFCEYCWFTFLLMVWKLFICKDMGL